MTNSLPPIYFYLSESELPETLPEKAQQFRPKNGIQSWTVQTYLRLKEDGFPCELTTKMPESGIVLAHRVSLKYNLKPGPRLMFVCFKGDRDFHPYAQLHIVQNVAEMQVESMVRRSPGQDRHGVSAQKNYYMPHWPQPGLIPRDPSRGEQFENVVYFGILHNLAPELKESSWRDRLSALDLHWMMERRWECWHDYSNVDAIVAVRSFNNLNNYSWKPATKLYNGWHAGVPVILGCDSAFRSERLSELDYLEVNSLEELISALTRLRDDVGLRQGMIENGRVRALETEPAMLVKGWRDFLYNVAVPEYDRWCGTSRWNQETFLMGRFLAIKMNRMQSQWHAFVSSGNNTGAPR